MIDAFRRASASRINAVIPYYGYARQDRKSRARDPITAKLVSNLIVEAGAQRVVAVDLHANQIQGFFDIPVDHLPGVPTIAEYFKRKQFGDQAVVVSPDVGGLPGPAIWPPNWVHRWPLWISAGRLQISWRL